MPFKPGHCPNLSGRPKGVPDRRTAFRDLIEPNSPLLIQKAVDMALEGNESMLKLILDRLLPAKPRDNAIDFQLPTNGLVAQSEAIVKALSKGVLSPSDANILMGVVESEAKVYEAEKLRAEVDELKKLVEIR